MPVVPPDICYFGELDPYTGSIAQQRSALRNLVRCLARLCLVRETVILPPGSLVEHGLALPALEQLAPLVRAGRLGTSADPRWPSPAVFFRGRIEQHLDLQRASKHSAGRDAVWRRAEGKRLSERWGAILPTQWSVHRDVSGQVVACRDAVLTQLERWADEERTTFSGELAQEIREEAAHRGGPTRDWMLARIAHRRGKFPARELARACTAVQAGYFRAGGVFKVFGTSNGAALYPGTFAARLRKYGGELGVATEIPYDFDLGTDALDHRFRAFGVDLERIVRLLPFEVAEIAASAEWRRLVRLVHQGAPSEVVREIFHRLARHDVRDALFAISPLLAPTVLQPQWQRGAQAILGSTLTVHETTDTVLDWYDFKLSNRDRAISLSPQEFHILSLLVLSGDVGLPLVDVASALLEVGAIQGGGYEPLRLPGRGTRRDVQLRSSIDVLKATLSARLRELGLAIKARRGRWQLVGPRIRMTNTPWELARPTAPPQPPPVALPPSLRQVWQVLALHSPNWVELAGIARILGSPPDDTTRMSKALWRLKNKLKGTGCLLVSDYVGRCRLILPGGSGEHD